MSFSEEFPSSCPADVGPRTFPSTAQLEGWANVLPADLLEFWRTDGWGSHLGGFLHFFDPALFQENFGAWINSTTAARVPFARTAFGEFFYWRDLTERARSLGMQVNGPVGDVSFLNIHTSETGMCGATYTEFLAWLSENFPGDAHYFPLFAEASSRWGSPSVTEFFAFVPALRLGGLPTAESTERVDGNVHLVLLRQLIG